MVITAEHAPAQGITQEIRQFWPNSGQVNEGKLESMCSDKLLDSWRWLTMQPDVAIVLSACCSPIARSQVRLD
jgi:hypothetical protein